MTDTKRDKVNKLIRYFAKQLPGKVKAIQEKWQQINLQGWDQSQFIDLLQQVRVLSGSTQVYGFTVIAEMLNELELFLQHFMHEAPRQEDIKLVENLLDDITHAMQITHNMQENPLNPRGKKVRRILTVDATIREIISAYLQDEDHVVYKAKDGLEALQLYDSYRPDVVLTDLHMPMMSGIELLKKLKEKDPQCMVLVISGAGKFDDAISALRLGAWDYIIKPFTKTVLEHALYRAFEHLRLEEEVRTSRMQLEYNNIQLTQSLEVLQADQRAGRTVQEQLLPKEKRNFKNYSISHKIIPSLYLSGDFADYFEINADKVGFYIADVSGHGASSAFVTVLLRGLMEKLLEKFKERDNDTILDPVKVLTSINNSIYEAKLGKYITMIYCVLDLRSNVLTYSVGGHYPSPTVYDGQRVYFLTGTGYAVGIHPNAKFENYTFPISEECTIGMFSDGILEILGEKNLQEKEEELLKIFRSSSSDIPHLMKSLHITDHNNNFPDDMTFMLISRNQ